MRWLILLPAGPGALLGGWLGEHLGLRAALVFAGVTVLAIAGIAWRQPVLRGMKVLPALPTLVENGEQHRSAPPQRHVGSPV